VKQNHSKPAVYGFGPNYDRIDWGRIEQRLRSTPPTKFASVRDAVRRIIDDLFALARRKP